jgi:ectoine hydroxylase-related dioxygenase (phytanoyl-CoA dioxygenase family)
MIANAIEARPDLARMLSNAAHSFVLADRIRQFHGVRCAQRHYLRRPVMKLPPVQIAQFNRDGYMYQFKINGKMAFEGDVWQWHHDCGTWLNDDKLPTKRAMNGVIFLDDVTEHNGPLMLISGSHKQGVVDAKHEDYAMALPWKDGVPETVLQTSMEEIAPERKAA